MFNKVIEIKSYYTFLDYKLFVVLSVSNMLPLDRF